MENNRKYFAFISYKREDEKWAKWLQHKLEHYKLPSNLNGRTDLPKEIRPIFRDQSELAGGVLADEINKALANSKYLIVICSPRAAQSVWVGKEVQTFIDLGRTDKIIPFIIGGMAHAQNPEEECFPLALLNLPPDQELLGINIDEMGRDAAAVKVVAQMFGLKFDALWQRYEREQRRRRVIFIAAALLLALIGVGVAVGFSRKNKRITEQNEQITKQNEEIVKQSEDIKRKNDRLMNDSVVMAAQLDSINRRDALIEIQKDSILHANYQILLTNNQIWAKNKKLRNQKLVQDIEISKNYLSQGKPEMAIVALEDVRKNVVLLDSLQKDNYGRLLLSINDSIMVRQVELLSISDYGNKKHKIIDSDSCIKKSPVVESYFREDRGGFEDKGDILWGEASLIISPENHNSKFDTIVGYDILLNSTNKYFAIVVDGDARGTETDMDFDYYKSGIRIYSLVNGEMVCFIGCDIWFDWLTYPISISSDAKYLVYREGMREYDRVWLADFENKNKICINNWDGSIAHRNEVKSDFSPEDEFFFVCYNNMDVEGYRISVFDSKTKELINTFYYETVDEVYWNHNDCLCIASEGKIYEWAIDTENIFRVFHADELIENVTISDDNKYVAAICPNGYAYVWNTRTKECLLSKTLIVDAPDDLEFTHDGRFLWVISGYNDVGCFCVDSKQIVDIESEYFEAPHHWPCFLKFTEDDKYCITYDTYSGYYCVYDVQTMRLLFFLPYAYDDSGFCYQHEKNTIGFLTYYSEAEKGELFIEIYDLNTGRQIETITNTDRSFFQIKMDSFRKKRIDFDPYFWEGGRVLTAKKTTIDRKLIVEGYTDGTLKVWPVNATNRLLEMMGYSN